MAAVRRACSWAFCPLILSPRALSSSLSSTTLSLFTQERSPAWNPAEKTLLQLKSLATLEACWWFMPLTIMEERLFMSKAPDLAPKLDLLTADSQGARRAEAARRLMVPQEAQGDSGEVVWATWPAGRAAANLIHRLFPLALPGLEPTLPKSLRTLPFPPYNFGRISTHFLGLLFMLSDAVEGEDESISQSSVACLQFSRLPVLMFGKRSENSAQKRLLVR
jgi:hypothetical protein